MSEHCFDFAYKRGAWTWTYAVGEEVISSATRAFATLHECVIDARSAGFSGAAGSHSLERVADVKPGI